MKKSIFILVVGMFGITNAQIPTGYYDGTTGLTGFPLKTKIAQIITSGYSQHSYDDLDTQYPASDADKYYEKDNTVLDVYSENPAGVDSYNYNFGVKKCGNYSVEGDCYNKEHTVPQSLFNQKLPMRSDIHHVLPTDGKVNGMRSNYPFGKVNNPSYISKNGSKLGPNASPGATYSGPVFEPINEFKGDIARCLLYFVTRYQSQLSSFSGGNILNTSDVNQGLVTWELNILLLWHQQDPVSQKEIDRNNVAFAYQKNRNPYIDHPEWVNSIWGTSVLAIDDSNFSKNLKIAPNPIKGNVINVAGDRDLKLFRKAFIYNMVGQNVQTIENPFQNGNMISIKNLPKGTYILKIGELNTKFIVD